MDPRLAKAIASFQKAHRQFVKSLSQPPNEFIRDAAIQRFEFTFELFWKLLKLQAAIDGVEVHSPRASIRAAFQLGIIDDNPRYLEMLESRNLTSHTYSEELAEKLFLLLPGYASLMEQAVNRIIDNYYAEADNS